MKSLLLFPKSQLEKNNNKSSVPVGLAALSLGVATGFPNSPTPDEAAGALDVEVASLSSEAEALSLTIVTAFPNPTPAPIREIK